MVPISLVYSIHDQTEVVIKKMIEASQRMLKVNSQGELGGISPPLKRHLELRIKILQNAPRDADKLRKLQKIKQRQKEEAMHIEDTQRLVTEEIEMLKVVLYLVSRSSSKRRR
jgi:Mg2+ and Co2+ transporter CorA